MSTEAIRTLSNEEPIIPEVGIWQDVWRSDYDRWLAINGSMLSYGVLPDGEYSMRRLKAYLDGKIKKTSSDLAYGRAIHVRLLEPHDYQKEVKIKGRCAASVKNGNPCRFAGKLFADDRWWCGTHAPAYAVEPTDAIDADQASRIEDMVEAIQDLKPVKFFKRVGGVEVSVCWRKTVEYFCDGQTRTRELLMKCRIDKLVNRYTNRKGVEVPPHIADLKKVQPEKHTSDNFGRSIFAYHYDMKAYLQLEALRTVCPEQYADAWFTWIALEDDWPFDMNPVHADKETLLIGQVKYENVLKRYCVALDTGVWPGVHEDLHEGGVTDWIKRQYRLQIEGDR